ncbi:MAG TPA: DedA family protein [Tepidisphaeraceae bacterium]|jgi:membrane protein DedA with SNARE-associated domain|nr:DedA family protein [Tepidisphaeraceae bacterium]
MIPFALLALFDANTVERWIEVGGPIAIFALLFACGLGLPLPEDIPLIIGGFFVAKGWNIWVVGSLAWLGIIGGDCVLYSLGRKYGLNITKVPFVGKHLTEARILKAEQLFERYGIWVVAVGRLFAGIRGAMVVAAGATRFNFVKFVIADGIAALVSGGLFVALGYYLGRKLDDVESIRRTIKPYEHWVIGGIVVAVVIVVAYIIWRKRRNKTVAEIAVEKVIEKTAPSGELK